MRVRAVSLLPRHPRDLVPEDYGAYADGDANAAPLTAAMSAAVEEGRILDLRGKSYTCRAQLSLPADERLYMRNGKIIVLPESPVGVPGGTNLVEQANTAWPTVGSLTADALRGTNVLPMSLVDGLAVGNRVVVWSSDEMTGYLPSYSRACDYGRIRSINTSTKTVTLFNRLRHDFLVSNNAAVLLVLETGGVDFENITIRGGGMGLSERGFTSQYAFGNRYRNFRAENLERSGFGEMLTMYSQYDRYTFEGTLSPESGYGISVGSCFGFRGGDIIAFRSRHAFTLAAPAAAANRLSGRDISFGNVYSFEAGGAAADQHPGAPPVTIGDVFCSMHEDADSSSPAVLFQGGGGTVGAVTCLNGRTGGIGFQCLGWYEHADYVPSVLARSVDGDGRSGMVGVQNRTNKGGSADGQKIYMRLDKPGGDWGIGIRLQAYDGDVEMDVGAGNYTCFKNAFYLRATANGRAILNAQGTSFTATSTTTTPVILQGKEWADAHPGELGAELNWYRGSFESGRKEIANSYGLVRADDLTVPPTTVIYQEGGQAVSPIYRWKSDGLVGAFDASASGLNLASNSAKFSIGQYNVVGFPQLGFKPMAGTAAPDGSGLNADTITATDGNIQALAKQVKALSDAMLAHGLTRFTDVLPPVNTVAPVVTGLPADGEALTTTNGTWTNTPTGYTYQWYRDGVARSGETASTYTQVAGDVGKTMTCVVTASNTGGSGTATSNGIKTGAPYNTVAPEITSDDLKIGTTLTCSTGTWGNTSGISYAYQWYRDLVLISGATANTRVIAIDDDGGILWCRVTATNANGVVAADSNSVGPIEAGWTMRNFDGIVSWAYADYLADGNVSSWTDVIGGVTVEQATVASQPVKSSTSFNGHPGVSGAAGGKNLAPSPQGVPSIFPKGANAGWIFVVVKLPAAPAVGNIMAYGDSSSTTARYMSHGETATGSGIYRLSANSPTSPRVDFVGSPDPLPEYAMLLGQWRSDGKVDLWVNGTFVATSDAPVTPYNTTAARFRLFAGAGASLGTPWTGEIGMWAVGAGDAEVADIQRAMGLGAWWYDLQDYLPEDHPYKHIAPWDV